MRRSPLAVSVSFVLLVTSLCLVAHAPRCAAQASAAPDSGQANTEPAEVEAAEVEAAEEKRERVTAERFLQLLRRRPRTGTALDKVYGYYVASGKLPEFCQSLQAQAEADNDGAAWMILGMVQQQRGNDTQAAEAFRQAEQLLPDEPLASYYLGKTLVLLGDVEGAAQAMRAAIEKKPARADMLALFQDLGRIFQRTGQNERALEVWTDLEALFPGDAQVQEEIARILAEEGALEQAVTRYDALAKSTKDRFRQVEMALRAAQLRAKLGQTEQALSEFEALLGRVNPDSWLHRDIRRRIEEVFWSSGDVDGLIDYYTNWVDKHPDDVDAMMRAARFLSVQRRLPEAKKWFRQAIDKAPSRAEPRVALVDALVTNGDLSDAAAEMEQLVEIDPDNPDYLVRWGELVLSDADQPEAARKTRAAEIWKRMLNGHEEDAVTVARVADLLRSADATDEALAQYRRAIELAPGEPQYREYLGEYLHQLGRKDEALEVWRQLASGDRETRDNLVRLSEVFSTFGYAEQALDAIARACEQNPAFAQRARYAELLREAGRHDDALAQLDLAEPLAEDPELRELVILERLKIYQASGSLSERIDEAEAAVEGEFAEDADRWRMLALLREADRKFQPACEAAEKATELAPGDPAIWETAATLQERSGKFGDAILSYRKLAAIDRRFLSNYLTQIASLELRLGNAEAALATGEELVASAPGNTEHARFFADLCFKLGEEERGLDVLRRGVRSAPNDDDTLLYLARMLSDAFRTDEAIELYWRAFDLAKDLDGQTAVITPLAELYLRTNRFEALTDRLDATGREANQPRQATLWVAAAHQAAGDLGAARQLLEQLAREDSRDTNLLKQLVTLSRAEYDHESAAEYQRRLVAAAPTPEAEYLLANILLDLGEIEQSEALWLKLAQRNNDPSAMIDAVSALVNKQQYETAAHLIDKRLATEPQNWELLAQSIIVNLKLEKADQARDVAKRILSMDVDPGAPSLKTKERLERMARSRANTRSQDFQRQQLEQLGRPSRLLQAAQQVKSLLNPAANNVYYSSSGMGGYEPSCFQDAQAIAYCVPLAAQEDGFDESEFVKAFAEEAMESGDADRLWRAIFYHVWQNPQVQYGQVANKSYDQCLEALVEQEDPYAAQARLSQFVNQRSRQTNGDASKLTPLDDDELERLEAWTDLAGSVNLGTVNYYQMFVASEFARAGRQDKADELIDGFVESARQNSGANHWTYLQAMSVMLNERYNAKPTEKTLARSRELFQAALESSKLTAGGGGQGGYAMVYNLLMAELIKRDMADEALQCVDDLLRWQAEQTAKLRPSQRDRISTSAGPMNFGRVVNGQYVQTTIAFPPPSSYFGSEAISIVHGLHEAASEDPELRRRAEETLAKWTAADTDDPYLRLARLVAKASFEYWGDDKAAARETLASAADLRLGAQFVNLALTRMLYEEGDIRGALRVAERLRPTNQGMLVDKELAILQLVLQIGDLDRAKESAQKLFALRLDSDVEFKLADLMHQLGMRELGDRMMSRIRRRAGGKQDTLAQLMTRYVTAGDNEQAAEIARQIIRRTTPRASRNRYTSENQQHEQAVRVLAQTGQLEPLIKQYEERLERSPKSVKLADHLAAFYEAAGRRDDADKLRMKAAENAPDDPRNLLAAGQRLAGLGKHSEAADKFIAAVVKSPDSLNQNYYEMQDSFENAKAWPRLVDAIIDEGIEKFAQSSYRFSEIIRELSEADEHEAINRLLYASLEDFQMQQAAQMFQSIARTKLKPDKKVADLLAEKLTAEDSDLDAGSSNTYVWSRSSNGECTGGVNGIAQIVASHDELKQAVGDNMRRRLEEDDSQLFPRVLLAMILIKDQQFDQLRDVVKPLLEKEEKSQIDGQAIWSLASELAHNAEQPGLACDLLEAVEDRSIMERGSSQFQFSAEALLAYAYQQAGRNTDARRILLDHMTSMEIDEQQNQYNPGYGEYNYIRSQSDLAERFVEMGYPAEAFIAFRNAYSDDAMLERAKRWGGSYDRQRDQLAEKITEKTTPEAILQIVKASIGGRPVTAAKEADAESPPPDDDSREEGTDNTPDTTPSGPDEAVSDDESAEVASVAAYLTTPEVVHKSLIDVRVTVPLEAFADKIADDRRLRETVAEHLNNTRLSAYRDPLPLKSLVVRQLACQAADSLAELQATSDAIVEWVETHPAAPTDAAAQTEGNGEKSDKLPDDLLLAMAVERLPASTDEEVVVALLERALAAAERSGQRELAGGLKARIAQRIAVNDKQRASTMLMSLLDDLLPADAEPETTR